MASRACLKLYGLGTVLLAALVACAYRGTSAAAFFVPLGVAAVAYLLSIRECFRTPEYPRGALVICLLLAALWRIPFLMTPLGTDDDIARYIWDGRVQRFGYSPYTAIPADPTMAWLHTPETRGLNNPDVPSPYPAAAQLFFRLVTATHESVLSFKIAFALCDLAIVLVLLDLLRHTGQGVHWVLAYAWHPLLATDVAGSGHIDIVGVLLLLVSVAALARRRQATAAIAFGLAVGVKFLPAVLIPLYWRRLRIRDALLAVLAFTVPYIPFLKVGKIPIGSLAIFVQRFRFNAPVFDMFAHAASPRFAAGLALLIGLAATAFLRVKPPRCDADAWAWPMAASLACAPVVYPWYMLWLLPFLRSVSTLPLTVWTFSIFSTYLVWYLRPLGYAWRVPGWVLLLEYGSVAASIALVWVILRLRPARAAAVGASAMHNAGSKTVSEVNVKILFICSGNRARSQLAEGWGKKLAPAGVEIWSAGTHPHPDGVHPIAIAVMREKGVDISRQYSKPLSEVPSDPDCVITLCSEADAECPALAARVARLAWHLPDPGIAGCDEKAVCRLFREIRDEIERRVRQLFSDPTFGKSEQG